ncbi:MAG: circadian clock KaiB family protein [Pleurocapsa sp.]
MPNIFKGIALFTPGGDLIYGVNPNRQSQWHSDLCVGMQKTWSLNDSPHFLVPGYTATVERWFNPQTQQIETLAEVYPAVERYIPLLQALFDVDLNTKWHIAPWREEHCNRAIIETYKPNFPQLWEQRDLIIRLDSSSGIPKKEITETNDAKDIRVALASVPAVSDNNGYVLRLFIRSDSPSAEENLNHIHQLLEQGLDSPYTLKVIDVNKNPQQAANSQISVTPTVVRVSPKPTRRIVGQLDDIQRVLQIITSF